MESLRQPGSFSLEGIAWWDLFNAYKNLMKGNREDKARLFSEVPSGKEAKVHIGTQEIPFKQ